MDKSYQEYLEDVIFDTLINQNKRHPKQRITLSDFIETIAASLDVLASITRKRKWSNLTETAQPLQEKSEPEYSLEADENFKELSRMMLEQGWRR